MRVIYTDRPGKDRLACYRLPAPFFGAIQTATEVVVDGDYPNIVDAYKRIGVEVNASGEDGNDDERRRFLLDEIERLSGNRPGNRTKDETLEKQYAELTKDQE